MNLLYNTGIVLYSAAARIVALRVRKVRRMIRGQKATRATLYQKRMERAPRGFDVWVHAASLGEFEQARPLIEKLNRERPKLRILLSFFSPSGYEVRKDYNAVDAVVYLPFDTPGGVRKFLDAAKPKMAIFVKYEFWGNFLQQLQERQIPTYIISAIFRPSQVFFRSYGGTFRKMLKCYDQLYVQDDNSKQLLAGIGIDNVTVAGDTRFDRVTDIMRSTVDFPYIEAWSTKAPTLVAGSSWAADEEYYIPYLNDHPALQAIIAPHEFDDKRIAQIQASLQGKSVRFSQIKGHPELLDDAQYLIVDCFGVLSSLYRYGTIALVGGGFGAGIHNINEAAVYGMPVVFGPRHKKFKEANDLINCGGAFEYHDDSSLAAILDMLLADSAKLELAGNAAKEYISSHLGATDMIYDQIFKKKPKKTL